jgi:RNA polymerase sigma-70 factor (ECF subfamily)
MPSPGRSAADRIAFDSLFEENHGAVLAYALRRARVEADAEDVAAETFSIAWRRLEAVPDEPLPWLYGVARRVLANQRRGIARRSRLIERLTTFRSTPIVPAPVEPVIEALARLSPDDQELLRLVVWEELTHAEIAAILGISPNAVAIRLHRARRRFADALQALTGRTAPKGSDTSRTSLSVKGRIAGVLRRGSAR